MLNGLSLNNLFTHTHMISKLNKILSMIKFNSLSCNIETKKRKLKLIVELITFN